MGRQFETQSLLSSFFIEVTASSAPADAEYDLNRNEGDLADEVKTRKRGITAGGRRERRQERREKAGRQIRNEEIRKKEDGSIKKK